MRRKKSELFPKDEVAAPNNRSGEEKSEKFYPLLADAPLFAYSDGTISVPFAVDHCIQ